MKTGQQKLSKDIYYVYILNCRDNTLYTGITNNLDNRIRMHNQKKGAKYTKGRTPVECIYFEELPSKGSALRREAYIKSLSKEKKKDLINDALHKSQIK